MECPCINCICLPICRYKPFYRLFKECSLVLSYETEFRLVAKRNMWRMLTIVNTLNPIEWDYVIQPQLHKTIPMVVLKRPK